MAPTVQARSWCFTVNNPVGEPPYLEFGSDVEFAVWQLERGEECHTPHLQGFLLPVKRLRMSSVKSLSGLASAHLEPARGTVEQNEEYCSKSVGRVAGPFTHGRRPMRAQGSRTELAAFRDAIKSGKRKIELLDEFPLECAKYPRFIKDVQDAMCERPPSPLATIVLRNWQEQLLAKLVVPPNDRTVMWIMDSVGNRGKTWFSKFLIQEHGAFYCSGGKSADIALMYMSEPIVIFDFTRDQEERVPYPVIEMFKNGLVFSPKYDSKMKCVRSPHVVCFANFRPDMCKLSQDRWWIRTIGNRTTPHGVDLDMLCD